MTAPSGRGDAPRGAGAVVRDRLRIAFAGDLDLALVVIALGLAMAMGAAGAPAVIRMPLGIAAALMLPGYSVSAALFPPGDLDVVERWALAFSLSLGLIVVLVPLLDLVAGGFDAVNIVVSVGTITLAAATIAWWRRYRAAGPGSIDRTTDHPGDVAGRVRQAIQVSPRAAGLLAVAILFCIFVVAGLVDQQPRPTEFTLAGPDGTTASLPTSVTAGTPLSFTAAVFNGDAASTRYHIVVEPGSAPPVAIEPFLVGAGETWSGSVTITLPSPGPAQDVLVVLYRGTDPQPYRTLRLHVDVLPG
jgi:uncharacterized membrane protein